MEVTPAGGAAIVSEASCPTALADGSVVLGAGSMITCQFTVQVRAPGLVRIGVGVAEGVCCTMAEPCAWVRVGADMRGGGGRGAYTLQAAWPPITCSAARADKVGELGHPTTLYYS